MHRLTHRKRYAAHLVCAVAMIAMASSASAVQKGFEFVSSSGEVYRVVDADTFVVNLDDASAYRQLVTLANGDEDRLRYLNDRFQSIRVRLSHVDTPESSHPIESRNTPEGARLSRQVTDMLEGQRTEVTCFDWGYHGRAICSMSMPNGDDLGRWLIERGHSDYITRWGRHPYMDAEYRAAER